MQAMVLTILGKDRAGLIDAIAKSIIDADGNWLRSSFCQLSGQFAGFIEVMLPKEKHQQLVESCHAISDLSITLLPSDEHKSSEETPLQLKVTANDRKGIVSDISSCLKKFDINIVEMSTECTSAPNWGNPVFAANIMIIAPSALDVDELQDTIEAISDDLMVEISSNNE